MLSVMCTCHLMSVTVLWWLLAPTAEAVPGAEVSMKLHLVKADSTCWRRDKTHKPKAGISPAAGSDVTICWHL